MTSQPRSDTPGDPSARRPARSAPRRAVNATRIAALRPDVAARLHCPSPAPEFVCGRCHVAWAGAEADCWNCGLPATTWHARPGSALQHLLHGTRPHQKTR
ncbi:hypothetical protein [Streptomyces megasporus]|uniref:hypothetical protein n=1 Tax=Streptomyces megasporus TaxID=44060 RepID=UPI0012FF2434|nr:hypothetical protein [Streptomyces megasporus]